MVHSHHRNKSDYKPLLFPHAVNPASYNAMRFIYGFLQRTATKISEVIKADTADELGAFLED